MIGKRQATQQQVVQAALFAVFFFVPLFLIPVFPGSPILQSLNASGTCVNLLAVLAGCTSALITWVLFRARK